MSAVDRALLIELRRVLLSAVGLIEKALDMPLTSQQAGRRDERGVRIPKSVP